MSARICIHLLRRRNLIITTAAKHWFFVNSARSLSTSTSVASLAKRQIDKPNWWRRILKMDLLSLRRHRNKEIAYRLYVCCSDGVDHQKFFSYFDLEDTLNSLFLITELHVWMMTVRVMQEEKLGKQFRYDLVEAMWKDIEKKSKVLGFSVGSRRRDQLETMCEQFQAALFSYDEGLLTNDVILASALWRRFLSGNSENTQHLELLVNYVRRSIHYLDMVEHDDLLTKGSMKWPPLLEKNPV